MRTIIGIILVSCLSPVACVVNGRISPKQEAPNSKSPIPPHAHEQVTGTGVHHRHRHRGWAPNNLATHSKMTEYFVGSQLVGVRYWYPNGRLQAEFPMKNRKRDGIGREWHENGRLMMLAPYMDDLLNGVCSEWLSDGTLVARYEFIEGAGLDVWRTTEGVLKRLPVVGMSRVSEDRYQAARGLRRLQALLTISRRRRYSSCC